MISIVSARFIKSATVPKDFPKLALPEFAFFGRSNAGKSSLINMLLNRKQLVKTGSRPGMTQTINFFVVNEQTAKNSFVLADLPGYGFAKVRKNKIAEFELMLYNYCKERKNIAVIFLLMDIRRPPQSLENDIALFFTENAIPFKIVATKADKLSKTEQQKSRKALAQAFALPAEEIIISSTLKKQGREALLGIIQKHCADK